MSYCRFGDDSNVYLYITGTDPLFWHCCGCKYGEPHEGVSLDSIYEAIAHMCKHAMDGDKVPAYVFEDLAKEITEPFECDVSKLTLLSDVFPPPSE